jgi:heme a synthase
MSSVRVRYTLATAARLWPALPVLPLAFLAFISSVSSRLKNRYLTPSLTADRASQGFIGWWMVRSGLHDTPENSDIPRVSPYRLAVHLTSAFIIYSTLLWTTLSLAFPVSPAMVASAPQVSGARAIQRWALPLAALIGTTAVSGAIPEDTLCSNLLL